MTAIYWTKSGSDMWKLQERRVFDFKNLDTGEVVTCEGTTSVLLSDFVPVIMPKVKKRDKTSVKPAPISKTKKSKKKATKPSPQDSSKNKKGKYKGVSPSKTPGKFCATFWDKKKKKIKHIGTFDSELLAAAAYQEHIGNKKEAQRLRNEYDECDRRPEAPEPQVEHKKKTTKQKKGKSKYRYVSVKQSINGPRYYAQAYRGGKFVNLGAYSIEELAAAAVEDHMGTPAEAARLRKIAQEKTQPPTKNQDD